MARQRYWTRLSKAEVDFLNYVKQHMGFEADSEALRFCIQLLMYISKSEVGSLLVMLSQMKNSLQKAERIDEREEGTIQ